MTVATFTLHQDVIDKIIITHVATHHNFRPEDYKFEIERDRDHPDLVRVYVRKKENY